MCGAPVVDGVGSACGEWDDVVEFVGVGVVVGYVEAEWVATQVAVGSVDGECYLSALLEFASCDAFWRHPIHPSSVQNPHVRRAWPVVT